MNEAPPDYKNYSKRGWDGEDAEPITPATVDAARCLAHLIKNRPMYEAPGADGSIGFEWLEGTGSTARKLFIDIGPDDSISIYLRLGGRTLQSRF